MKQKIKYSHFYIHAFWGKVTYWPLITSSESSLLMSAYCIYLRAKHNENQHSLRACCVGLVLAHQC